MNRKSHVACNYNWNWRTSQSHRKSRTLYIWYYIGNDARQTVVAEDHCSKWCITYRIMAISMTLGDLQGHSFIANLFKRDFSCIIQVCHSGQDFNSHNASLGPSALTSIGLFGTNLPVIASEHRKPLKGRAVNILYKRWKIAEFGDFPAFRALHRIANMIRCHYYWPAYT